MRSQMNLNRLYNAIACKFNVSNIHYFGSSTRDHLRRHFSRNSLQVEAGDAGKLFQTWENGAQLTEGSSTLPLPVAAAPNHPPILWGEP